jgi:hypothetical protein
MPTIHNEAQKDQLALHLASGGGAGEIRAAAEVRAAIEHHSPGRAGRHDRHDRHGGIGALAEIDGEAPYSADPGHDRPGRIGALAEIDGEAPYGADKGAWPAERPGVATRHPTQPGPVAGVMARGNRGA